MHPTPYYAVIFTSRKKSSSEGYNEMSDKMESLAKKQKGYLGIHSARNPDGFGITVSYWQTLAKVERQY
jgi:heme-degrading monooxygenase HmoA